MKWNLVYMKIIENARNSNRIKDDGNYYEQHHIIPYSIGKSNEKENLVLLTAREHYFCHKLLCKIYSNGKDHLKMTYALFRLHYGKNGYQIKNSKDFERIRIQMKNSIKYMNKDFYNDPEWRYKCGSGRRGKTTSDEMKKKISESVKKNCYRKEKKVKKFFNTDLAKQHKKESHWLKGKSLPIEIKIKGQITQSLGKIRCIEINEIFMSSREAEAKYKEFHHSCILACCRGKRKSHCGLHFEWYKGVK